MTSFFLCYLELHLWRGCGLNFNMQPPTKAGLMDMDKEGSLDNAVHWFEINVGAMMTA